MFNDLSIKDTSLDIKEMNSKYFPIYNFKPGKNLYSILIRPFDNDSQRYILIDILIRYKLLNSYNCFYINETNFLHKREKISWTKYAESVWWTIRRLYEKGMLYVKDEQWYIKCSDIKELLLHNISQINWINNNDALFHKIENLQDWKLTEDNTHTHLLINIWSDGNDWFIPESYTDLKIKLLSNLDI